MFEFYCSGMNLSLKCYCCEVNLFLRSELVLVVFLLWSELVLVILLIPNRIVLFIIIFLKWTSSWITIVVKWPCPWNILVNRVCSWNEGNEFKKYSYCEIFKYSYETGLFLKCKGNWFLKHPCYEWVWVYSWNILVKSTSSCNVVVIEKQFCYGMYCDHQPDANDD